MFNFGKKICFLVKNLYYLYYTVISFSSFKLMLLQM